MCWSVECDKMVQMRRDKCGSTCVPSFQTTVLLWTRSKSVLVAADYCWKVAAVFCDGQNAAVQDIYVILRRDFVEGS